MKTVFVLVMHALQWCAEITGFTYNDINIIVFYMIIPFVYAAMLDGIIRRHWIKIAVVAAWGLTLLVIPSFNVFCDRFFALSVAFLLLFSHVGLNYTAASVVICVIVPILAFGLLAAGLVVSRRKVGGAQR